MHTPFLFIFLDNPYYFNSDLPAAPTTRQPPSPTSSTKSGGFFFFRRRSSSSGSSKSVKSPKTKTFNSATLGSEAAILGNRRSSLSSLMRPAASSGPASLPLNYLPNSPYGHPTGVLYGTHSKQPHHVVYDMDGRHSAEPMYRNTMQMTSPKRIFFGNSRPRFDSSSSGVENDEVFLHGSSGPSRLVFKNLNL